MRIQIKTQHAIPVEIGELTFYVSMNDDNIKQMVEKFEVVGEELKAIKTDDLAEIKDVFIKALDILLEDGAGQKIYEKYPSTFTLNDITVQLLANLKEEVESVFKTQTQSDVMDEYIKKKNK